MGRRAARARAVRPLWRRDSGTDCLGGNKQRILQTARNGAAERRTEGIAALAAQLFARIHRLHHVEVARRRARHVCVAQRTHSVHEDEPFRPHKRLRRHEAALHLRFPAVTERADAGNRRILRRSAGVEAVFGQNSLFPREAGEIDDGQFVGSFDRIRIGVCIGVRIRIGVRI